MISMKSTLFGIGIVLLLILGSGCLTYVEEPNASTTQTTPDVQGVNASDVSGEEPVGSMPSECKGNCTECHGLAHGTQLRNCTECHDAHDPMSNFSSPRLEQFCSQCHPQQFEEFSGHPGGHAKLKCVYCHRVHRHIEACINCHAPHSAESMYDDCLNCHPAHTPQEIEYPATVSDEQCGNCHKGASIALAQGNTMHSSLKCTYCHTTHEQIPDCMDCHAPHTQNMTYDDCIGCHPAHNPVDIKFSSDIPREDCAACHKEVDSELRGSNTKHNNLNCVYCHPEHRYLPTCESCHGLPHKNVYNVHTDYPDCSQCHIAPHDVNNIVFTRQ